MTWEIAFVFAVLAGTIVVFILDRIRMDAVALGVMVILAVSGVITPAEAISGFGEPVVLMIAGLFLVGEGLFRTGVAATVGRWIMRVGGHSETRLMLLLLPVIAVLSAFMSSTGAVALMIPVVMSMTAHSSIHAPRILMPMAFAALIGGMLTLIGTPPNIIVTDALYAAGMDSFGFFAFTPLGLAILIVGSLYLVFVARFLLPKAPVDNQSSDEHLNDLFKRYELTDQIFRVMVPAHSPLVGQTVIEAELRSCYDVTVFGSRHQGQTLSTIEAVLINSRIQAGDNLFVYARREHVQHMCDALNLQMSALSHQETIQVEKYFGALEVLITPQSRLENQTLKAIRFRAQYGVNVVGIRRKNSVLNTDYNNTPLLPGDTLLLSGSWGKLRALEGNGDFVLMREPVELRDAPTHGDRAPFAIVIVAMMMVLMTSGLMDNLTAILVAALAMIATGCINLTEAYRSLSPRSLVLIAGMIPLALAMQSSGAAELLVQGTLNAFGDANPVVLIGGVFVLTALLSQFISNTATTVLMAPITLGIAQGLGVNPMPFMMAVAIAASAAFATPIASPVNTLVVAPGNYRFIDFVRVGVPLQLLALAVALFMLPRLFPF